MRLAVVVVMSRISEREIPGFLFGGIACLSLHVRQDCLTGGCRYTQDKGPVLAAISLLCCNSSSRSSRRHRYAF
jgi:hypothetical protein